jgi:predicted Zn-dependent peptidase
MLRRSAVLLLGLLLAAPLLAQPPDRTAPPPVGPPRSLRLPAVQKSALSNGIPVWSVELDKVPVVQVSLLVFAGASADPAGKFGVASMTAAMLDEGAAGRSALDVADAVDYLGANLATTSGYDSSAVRLWVPAARLKDALPVMADVALRPTFPAAELERLRKERLTSMSQSRDDPRSVASLSFPRLLYGPQHRYGVAVNGTPASVQALGVGDLEAYYRANYRPGNAAIVVVGATTKDAVVPLLEAAFGGWKPTGAGPTAAPAAAGSGTDSGMSRTAQPPSRHVYIIDKPGAPQSQIAIGGPGVARSTPDYFPIEVMNTILGGSFSSRLNQNLREKHGYTYGAGSGFAMRLAAGPFLASAGVQTEVTAEALKEFFNELGGIRQPVPAEELARGKNYLALSFPSEFETSGQIAGQLEELLTYKLAEDYYATYVQHVQGVTAAQVQQAAQKYILPARFAVVIVGDRKAVEAPVRALGLGPVTVMTVDQALGPAK